MGDIARHLSSIAATSLLVAENGLHRGQHSTVQELSTQLASDVHSPPAFAAVSAWQEIAIRATTPTAARGTLTQAMRRSLHPPSGV
jgi:hypothetical protein